MCGILLLEVLKVLVIDIIIIITNIILIKKTIAST
jgi:hypothetical protein